VPSQTAADPFGVAALRLAYLRGETRPTGVVEQVLDRLARRDASPVWISVAGEADMRARAIELEADGPSDRRPLYGVPFAVKDNIDVAGLPTTAGCPDFGYLPKRNATAVQRLLDAGAILVGKTNLDQFATGLTGARSPYGACESVFGGGLVSGGSSSGSAVAVAAGLVAFSLGTDTAGSGRVPAALNGLVGVKPTRGLVSTTGVVPACRSLDCVSVFAHDVDDGWAVLRVLAGPDESDPWSRRGPPWAPLPSRGSGWRLGVPLLTVDDFFGDTAMKDRFEDGVRTVRGVAGSTHPVEFGPFLEAGDLLYEGPWTAERLCELAGFLDAHPESVLPVTRGILERGRGVDGVTAFAGMHRLQHLKSVVDRVFETIDVLLLPTVGTTATHDEVRAEPLVRNSELGRYTQFANLLDLAVVSVPNGFTVDGRPASISFVGPAFSDATLSAVAHAFEAERRHTARESSWTPPPASLQIDGAQVTPVPLPATARSQVDTQVMLAVVGHHLTRGPRNHELVERGGRLLETTTTAAAYRLYAVGRPPHVVPGLVRCGPADPTAGAAIEVEVWGMPSQLIGSLLSRITSPLGLGQVELADGREVLGFLCEGYVVADALDITAGGGWRAHLAASAEPA
jgi:allophanate hydrolase